jgi:hypothetical protein
VAVNHYAQGIVGEVQLCWQLAVEGHTQISNQHVVLNDEENKPGKNNHLNK